MSTPSPPPEYETVIAMSDYKEECEDIERTFYPWRRQSSCGVTNHETDDSGLPSYEAAMNLGAPNSVGHLWWI